MTDLRVSQALRKSSLCLAIGMALGTGMAHAVNVGTENELRTALDNAEPQITLSSNITLSSYLPSLRTATTIEGGGFTLDGNDNTCLESFGRNLVVSNLTLSGCSNSYAGGGIFVNGADLTVDNSTISGNSSDADGGGIYLSNGNLELTDSTVSGNEADGFGGGVAVKYGNVLVRNSTISGNTAEVGGGVWAGTRLNPPMRVSQNPEGILASTEHEFDRAIISGNTATASGRGAVGGGIAAFDFELLRITESTISGNTAVDPEDIAYGGGMLAYGGRIEVTDTSITGNSAQGQPFEEGGPLASRVANGPAADMLQRHANRGAQGSAADESLAGGAFMGAFNGSTITRSTIADNQVGLIAGGLLAFGETELIESTLSGNQALFGGGISSKYGGLTLTASTISGNAADAAAGILAKYSAAIENSTISGNTASFEAGGASLAVGSTVRFSTVHNNNAGDLGGGILANGYLQAIDGLPGGGTTVDIFASIVAGNTAAEEPDLAIPDVLLGGGGSLGFEVSLSLIGEAPTRGIFNIDAGTLVGLDPMLGPLGNNGGPTQTHRPLPGSPVITLIPAAACDIGTDQRGLGRGDMAGCTAGSVDVVGERGVETDAIAVPIMNRIGLTLTAGLLALFGLLGLRRRRIV